jgi:hypothetical protein
VNSDTWARLSKTVLVRLDTLQFGVHDAGLCFNVGVPAATENDVSAILGVS